jgi:hypothetical protein
MIKYDAIVIGSGISGGWSAKELCEKPHFFIMRFNGGFKKSFYRLAEIGS